MSNLNSLKECAEKSLTVKHSISYEIDITLLVDGEKFKAYEVSISHRDLLFFTDKGTLNYLVDSYGDRLSIELFNIERD